MIAGVVNNFHEATVLIGISDSAGQQHEIQAVIDTGFNGYLSLPSQVIRRLGLRFRGRGRALLADGSETVFDSYEAEVTWGGRPRRVAVDEADIDPLIGMSLLRDHKLTIDVVAGGIVTIEPLI